MVMKNNMPYSFLVSVYSGENSEYFKATIECMLNQTLKPDEIVMVKDGVLTDELEKVLNDYAIKQPNIFTVVAYPDNKGLGYALSQGVIACRNEIIARMDTDDLSVLDRMEKQLALFADDESLDMVGSQITEFIESPNNPISLTKLPEAHKDIVDYSKKRDPFRHPTMVMRRSKILIAGNYNGDYLFFEDWDLFNRMLASGCIAANLHEPLVAVRVSPNFYERRGGISYLKHAYSFKSSQVKSGWFTHRDFLASFLPQAFVCIVPNKLRGLIYLKLLRKSVDAL